MADSPAPSKKKKEAKQITFRGAKHTVVDTERDSLTGAVYDYIEVPKTVLNKQLGKNETVTIGRRIRRAGTGGSTTRMVPVGDDE